MELNEMEKKLLFQVEGDYQTKILNELYMTVRYSNNSEQREAAEGLMAKLRVLSNAESVSYTHLASEIMLPPHAPEIYLDRATLWNAVENCEKHPKAQLAYSFDIAMQNELTLEENMELARKFVQEQFVTKGMIADLAFHSPEKEDGGIPNPHFHVMTTMRPLNPDCLLYTSRCV